MARLLIAVLFFVGLATALPVSACIYLFIYLSVYLFIYLFIFLFIYLFNWFYLILIYLKRKKKPFLGPVVGSKLR